MQLSLTSCQSCLEYRGSGSLGQSSPTCPHQCHYACWPLSGAKEPPTANKDQRIPVLNKHNLQLQNSWRPLRGLSHSVIIPKCLLYKPAHKHVYLIEKALSLVSSLIGPILSNSKKQQEQLYAAGT